MAEGKQRDLFISFVGRVGEKVKQGWAVCAAPLPISSVDDIQRLMIELEVFNGYDKDSVSIISFQRLEEGF